MISHWFGTYSPLERITATYVVCSLYPIEDRKSAFRIKENLECVFLYKICLRWTTSVLSFHTLSANYEQFAGPSIVFRSTSNFAGAIRGKKESFSTRCSLRSSLNKGQRCIFLILHIKCHLRFLNAFQIHLYITSHTHIKHCITLLCTTIRKISYNTSNSRIL